MTEELPNDLTQLGLTQLGRPTPLPASPDAARLERVHNPAAGTHYVVRFTCPEFTALCPLTGQPDFAHIVLNIRGRTMNKGNSEKTPCPPKYVNDRSSFFLA